MLLEITQKTMRTSMEVMVGELGRHDFREKKFFFFSLVTTFTAPWLREKPFFFISALRSIRHGYKKNLIFIEALLWLRYDHDKNVLFLFHWDAHYENIFLHDLTSLTTSLTCRKISQTVFSPEKNMCNLKNVLPQEFQWSLTWFTSLNV